MPTKTKAQQNSNGYGHTTTYNGRAEDAYHSEWSTRGGGGGGGGGDGSSPSPPPSPGLHPNRISSRHRRRRILAKVHSFALRRRSLRYLMLVPMLYASGLLLCVENLSELVGLSPVPGSVYRSPELFEKLWEDIQADNSSATELSSFWKYRSRLKKMPKPCPNSTPGSRLVLQKEISGPVGYLIVEANGGLNQQRSAICNAVAVAGLLNAVLVIPHFEFNSVWRDPSEFGDIYDEDHFIATLEGYVKVAKELPEDLMARFNYSIANITNFRVQAWAPVSFYVREVYPILREQGVVRIAPFANRLAMNVPPYIQFLRCMTNYKALRFSSAILTLAEKLVNRMMEKSSQTGGKYVSVHLRFEEDMVAFSCCVYDGGKDERSEMDLLREKGWKGKFKQRYRVIRPGLNRINGKCPLTPLEVGMMLRGMGFSNTTSIYLASGKIYNAERHLKPLIKMFPFVYTKESLARPDELSSFEGFSSRMAALDYMVSLLSEVFVTTQGGNFPHFLMGHRRFFFDGHAKTIVPDKPKLVFLLQDMDISWASFKDQMELMLAESDRKSIMVPRVTKINRKTSIFMYPLPECQCLRNSADLTPKFFQNFNAFASTNTSITR